MLVKHFFKGLFLNTCLLLNFISFAIDSVQIHKLTPDDITQAQAEILKAENFKLAMRKIILAAGTVTAGYAFFKLGKWAFGSKLEMPIVLKCETFADVNWRLNNLEKLNQQSEQWLPWIKKIILSNPAIFLPIAVHYVNDTFSKANITQLIYRSKIDEKFNDLQRIQIRWEPAEFVKNINYQQDRTACLYAYQTLYSRAQMSENTLIKIKTQAQSALVESCNEIINDMVYVIACVKSISLNSKSSDLLDSCAEQINRMTYDFACKVEQSLIDNNAQELFNAVIELRANYDNTVKSILIFAK